MSDDIVDLAAFRQRKQSESTPSKSYVKAYGPDQVEFWFKINGDSMPALFIDIDGARKISRMFSRAAQESWKLTQPKCRVCGKHECTDWHVGHLYRGWSRGKRVIVRCEKFCKRSIRLRIMKTGEAIYTQSTSWDLHSEESVQ